MKSNCLCRGTAISSVTDATRIIVLNEGDVVLNSRGIRKTNDVPRVMNSQSSLEEVDTHE